MTVPGQVNFYFHKIIFFYVYRTEMNYSWYQIVFIFHSNSIIGQYGIPNRVGEINITE